jgi:hypothetical protein
LIFGFRGLRRYQPNRADQPHRSCETSRYCSHNAHSVILVVWGSCFGVAGLSFNDR